MRNDDDIDDLNPGIVRTVAILREAGFETCDSGDGQTHEFECDRDHPYVVFRSTPERMIEDARKAVELLEARGLECVPIQPESWDDGMFSVQASYDVANGSCFVDVMGVADRHLPPEGWT